MSDWYHQQSAADRYFQKHPSLIVLTFSLQPARGPDWEREPSDHTYRSNRDYSTPYSGNAFRHEAPWLTSHRLPTGDGKQISSVRSASAESDGNVCSSSSFYSTCVLCCVVYEPGLVPPPDLRNAPEYRRPHQTGDALPPPRHYVGAPPAHQSRCSELHDCVRDLAHPSAAFGGHAEVPLFAAATQTSLAAPQAWPIKSPIIERFDQHDEVWSAPGISISPQGPFRLPLAGAATHGDVITGRRLRLEMQLPVPPQFSLTAPTQTQDLLPGLNHGSESGFPLRHNSLNLKRKLSGVRLRYCSCDERIVIQR